MSAFTPGPWEVREWGEREVDVLGNGARVAGVSPWADKRQTLADARLIAAAPDLYAALLALLSTPGVEKAAEAALEHGLIASAYAALAKAQPRPVALKTGPQENP